MKVLIAVKSCWRDLEFGCHKVIRETWGKDVTGENKVLFFVGNPGLPIPLQPDEIQVDAPDGYHELGHKVKEFCKYALKNEYDYVFSCDTDTIILWHHLLKCGFEDFEYTGYWPVTRPQDVFMWALHDDRDNSVQHLRVHPWASGGVGYFLSRKAMEIIVETPIDSIWPEDMWVGQTLYKQGVFFRHPLYFEGYCVVHARDIRPGRLPILSERMQLVQRWYKTASKICEREGCNSLLWGDTVDKNNCHFCKYCERVILTLEESHSCGRKTRALAKVSR